VIERPKRAVTRFFIPLIDVLILLFCIFLLMPFMQQSGSAEPLDRPDEKKNQAPEEMSQELALLRIDLDKARREIKKLRAERKEVSEKTSVFVLDIDAKNGHLFYYKDGKPLEIVDRRTAQEVIDEHKLRAAAADKEPFFIIVLPADQSARRPERNQLVEYHNWFREAPHGFSNPLGPLPEIK
jgi:septal ring factor EnvC (AmiA/AmiB activator)